jgi:hypothetical protein
MVMHDQIDVQLMLDMSNNCWYMCFFDNNFHSQILTTSLDIHDYDSYN